MTDVLKNSSKTCTKCGTKEQYTNFYSYRRKNNDKIFYQSKCKDCHKEEVYARAKRNNYYRKDNKKRCRKFYKNNKEYFREYSREYIRVRRETDKEFLIKDRVSTQVYLFCKKRTLYRDKSFWKTISYEPKVLLEHLELQFWYGMSWDNYGEWHIDHIKPKSKFQIESFGDEQFMECWALVNLQPLWGEDNVLKGDKFNEEF